MQVEGDFYFEIFFPARPQSACGGASLQSESALQKHSSVK